MPRTQKVVEKTNQKAPKPAPAPTPSLSPDEKRSRMIKSLLTPDDPTQLIPQLYDQMKERDGQIKEKDRNIFEKGLLALGFENDYTLLETVDEKYRPMTIELRRQLIKDFDCKTYTEKVLVDSVVSGYMRHLRCARGLNNCIGQGSTTAVLNNFMGIMSKEMDRAQRQLMTALQTLMSLKRPPLKVHVKAQNAFVAQNQQLNVRPPQPSPVPHS